MSLDPKEYAPHIERDERASQKLVPSLKEWFSGMHGKNVADFGCGSGAAGGLLVDRFIVIGIDEQESALIKAQKRGLKTIQTSLEGRIPLDSASLDNAICKDVFEHLVHPHRLRDEIHRTLRRGGRLYAHVPNQFTLLDRVQIVFGRNMVVSRWFPGAEEWDFPHVRFFTRDGFRKFLEEGGFVVVREYEDLFYYHLPFNLTTRWLSRLFPSLFAPGFTFTVEKK